MRIEKNIGAALLGCALLLLSCNQQQQQQTTQDYKLLEIKQTDVNLSSHYSASIRGRQDIKIVPRVAGHLTDIHIKEGSKVKKNQVLFVIDQVPFKAELQGATAQVSVCQANVATAELNYNSKRNLYAKKIVSEFDLQSADNNLKTAKAQLEQAKAQETAARNNLSYTVIKSPSDGVVGKLPYRKGDYVTSAMPEGLTVVADNSQMYVYFSMTERQVLDLIQEYKNIETAIAKLPEVELQLINNSVYAQKGRIESISGVIDTSTGAVSVRAAFPNKEGRLLSGGAGSVIVPYVRKGAVVIPQEATYEIQDKVYVYKVIDGVAKSAIVEVDKINNGKEYIVSSGLTPGDVIIAEGAGLVQEGTQIKAANADKDK